MYRGEQRFGLRGLSRLCGIGESTCTPRQSVLSATGSNHDRSARLMSGLCQPSRSRSARATSASGRPAALSDVDSGSLAKPSDRHPQRKDCGLALADSADPAACRMLPPVETLQSVSGGRAYSVGCLLCHSRWRSKQDSRANIVEARKEHPSRTTSTSAPPSAVTGSKSPRAPVSFAAEIGNHRPCTAALAKQLGMTE